MILVFRLVMLVAIILALLFCMSNLEPVAVKLLGWESPEMPLFLVLMFVFFFGFFLALVWQAWSGVSQRPVVTSAPVPAPKPVKEPKVKKEKPGRIWGKRKKDKDRKPKDEAADSPTDEKKADEELPEQEERTT